MAITCNFIFNKVLICNFTFKVFFILALSFPLIDVTGFKLANSLMCNRELQLYKCFYVIWDTALIRNSNDVFKKKNLKWKKYRSISKHFQNKYCSISKHFQRHDSYDLFSLISNLSIKGPWKSWPFLRSNRLCLSEPLENSFQII